MSKIQKVLDKINLAWDKEPELLKNLGFDDDLIIDLEDLVEESKVECLEKQMILGRKNK